MVCIACPGLRIRLLSVSSTCSAPRANPNSCWARVNSATRSLLKNCTAETLTAIGSSPHPASTNRRCAFAAARITQRPSARISPVSSHSWMNSLGGMKLPSACGQRSNASNAAGLPSLACRIGWKYSWNSLSMAAWMRPARRNRSASRVVTAASNQTTTLPSARAACAACAAMPITCSALWPSPATCTATPMRGSNWCSESLPRIGADTICSRSSSTRWVSCSEPMANTKSSAGWNASVPQRAPNPPRRVAIDCSTASPISRPSVSATSCSPRSCTKAMV